MMSALPCLFAFSYCNKKYYSLNIKSFLYTSLSFILFNLSVNTISEYRDCVKGIDDKNSPGTKFRLVTGIVPEEHIKNIGIISFIFASICGIFALLNSSLLLIIPGILGASIALFYSEKPFCIKYKALGEIAVFIAYGPLLGFSTLYSLTKQCSFKDILIFIPGALLITNVLLANNIRDYYFDIKNIKTIVTVIGRKYSYILLYIIAHLSFILLILFVYYNILSYNVLWILCLYPFLLFSIIFRNNPKFINFWGCLFFISEIICIILN